MLKELLDLELSEVSGGDIHCSACGNVITQNEIERDSVAVVFVAYNVFTEGLAPRLHRAMPAIVHNDEGCINAFINLQPSNFTTDANVRYIKNVGRTQVYKTNSIE